MPQTHDQPSQRLRLDPEDHRGDDNSNEPDGVFGNVSGKPWGALRHGESWMASNLPKTRREDQSARALSGRGRRAPRTWSADGDLIRKNSSSSDHYGPRFDIDVCSGGYAWWYIDAISDDGAYGITTIAFIGSVFSPYYAWSKKRDPFDHCALNVALYGPRQNRWAMTERGQSDVSTSRDSFQVGPSAMEWDGEALTIHVAETTAPIPRGVRGRIRITPEFLNANEHLIDGCGKHRWRPVAPRSRIDVEFTKPELKWSGYGYFDSNTGDEPLEEAFRYWDWSRAVLPHGETAIFYNTDLWSGESQNLALKLTASG